MKDKAFETLVGLIVLIVAGAFLIFAYKTSDIGASSDSYKVSAKFDSVTGLNLGSDIKIGGIKIGVVTEQKLDQETYQAVLTFNINKNVKIPKDSTAAIVGDGLLGNKYVSIAPGADENFLSEGSNIYFTQSSINLESLIGKFIFGSVDNGA